MKKHLKFIAVFFLLIGLIGCSSVKKHNVIKPVNIKTDLVNITFNSISRGGYYYIDKKDIKYSHLYAATKETTNLEYRTFLNDLKSNGKQDLYKECMYDSTIWETAFSNLANDTAKSRVILPDSISGFNQPMVKNYHHHPAYDRYPIVNITYEAANEYCKWLTEQYMENDKREFKKVEFVLPTERQWVMACQPYVDNTLPWYGKEGYSANYEFYTNIKFRNTIGNIGFNYVEDGGFHTLIVAHYKPNAKGLFDIIGNVAEMTNVDGIQKGGSWDNLIEECTSDKQQNYNNADPRVGFRVYMKIIEK